METILKKDTAKDIWDSMKQKHPKTDFEILQLKVGESMNEYFARIHTIANKMRIHGETMSDVTIIEKILQSMTPQFNYVFLYGGVK